jgi:hypothetical protein
MQTLFEFLDNNNRLNVENKLSGLLKGALNGQVFPHSFQESLVL